MLTEVNSLAARRLWMGGVQQVVERIALSTPAGVLVIVQMQAL
jgi:hypothetical protein